MVDSWHKAVYWKKIKIEKKNYSINTYVEFIMSVFILTFLLWQNHEQTPFVGKMVVGNFISIYTISYVIMLSIESRTKTISQKMIIGNFWFVNKSFINKLSMALQTNHACQKNNYMLQSVSNPASTYYLAYHQQNNHI